MACRLYVFWLEIFQYYWIVGTENNTHINVMKYLQPIQKRWKSKRGNPLCLILLQRPGFPVWIITLVFKGTAAVWPKMCFLSNKVWEVWKSLLTLEWTGRFYLWQLVTFSPFHHWWPWIQASLLVSGHQRLQRQSCGHFGFATDHLTLGRPACGEL